MNILITNDDGIEAPGLRALYRAVFDLGNIHVVAPATERSACSHTLTLKRALLCTRVVDPTMGPIYAIDGTPADCVRLGVAELAGCGVDLVVSGINRGANAGVDTFYSGTVAGAREGAIMGLRSIAISQGVRSGVEVDWAAAARVARHLVPALAAESLPGPGFWNVNLPVSIRSDAERRVRRVPVAMDPAPIDFERRSMDGTEAIEFRYSALPPYWTREVAGATDFGVVRDGDIAVSAVPLRASF